MESSSGRKAWLGFVAAAIAVLTVHQGIVWLLTQAQLIKGQPWSMIGVAPFSVPQVLNGMFWGGLWGALFALIHDKLPGGVIWVKGLIYGLGILVVSNWIVLPLIKGQMLGQRNQALFSDFDPKRMFAGACILGGFGLATALIYSALSARR